mmetsp:Transcript_29781/g.71010  ORF Transcript_29781/g.71010 Transcript_29781/m.71010 type:complete len:221 (-) Transcript_29781:529-1191(-)
MWELGRAPFLALRKSPRPPHRTPLPLSFPFSAPHDQQLLCAHQTFAPGGAHRATPHLCCCSAQEHLPFSTAMGGSPDPARWSTGLPCGRSEGSGGTSTLSTRRRSLWAPSTSTPSSGRSGARGTRSLWYAGHSRTARPRKARSPRRSAAGGSLPSRPGQRHRRLGKSKPVAASPRATRSSRRRSRPPSWRPTTAPPAPAAQALRGRTRSSAGRSMRACRR